MKKIHILLIASYSLLLLLPPKYSDASGRSTAAYQPKAAIATAKIIPAPAQATTDVNIVTLGADNTGVRDCSALVRKAQQTGNVYFPAGTYLMGPVDVLPNRKYYGDGIGKTIIKAKHSKIKMLWGISTYDFDKTGHPTRDIENVTISDMTLDYNLAAGWIDYYSVILFKGKPGNFIQNIKLVRLEFMDSAKQVHPDAKGGNGKDAWSINFSSFADSTQDILVDKCVSNAESHQFVGGGGSLLKRVTVSNNIIQKAHANAVAFTTVSDKDVTFRDFTVTNNVINDAYGSAVLFGHDPGTPMQNGGVQIFTGLLVANNKISFGNYNVYGTDYRTKKSFPYVINLSGAEPYMKDVSVKNNEITVSDDYSGGDISFGKIHSYTFKRAAITTMNSFKQPAINSTIDIPIAGSTLNGKALYQRGSFAKIAGGGIYEITQVTPESLTLRLTNWALQTQPGSIVAQGSTVNFIGGKLENVQFTDNHITGNKSLRVVPGGIINGVVFKGNNKVAFTMPYANCIIDNAQINNNTDFSFSQTDGIIKGVMSGNKFKRGAATNLLKASNSVQGAVAQPDKSGLKMSNNN